MLTPPRIPSPWSTTLLLLFTAIFFQLAFAQDDQTITVQTETTKTLIPPTSVMSSKPSKTSSAPPQTYTVEVGKADHKFRPDVVQAAVGDTIEFDFFPANHSVVRAEYQFPCIPYEMTGAGKQGFWSGFHAVDAVLDNPPKYTLRINDTSPVFFYCSAPGSCISYGMVGVINPNATTSLEIQRQLAQNSSYMLSPGEPFPAESPLPTNLPPSSGTTTTPSNTTHAAKLTAGGIAGIAIACISVVVLGSLLFFFWGRFRGLKDEVKRKESSVTRNTTPATRFSSSFFPFSTRDSHSRALSQSTNPSTISSHTQLQHNPYTWGDYESKMLPSSSSTPSSYASPMSAHANPAAGSNLPPSYYPSVGVASTPQIPGYTPIPQYPRAFSSPSNDYASPISELGGGGTGVGGAGGLVGLGISRAEPQRSEASHGTGSVGGGGGSGSQTSGYYYAVRTHENNNQYTSDMTSPVDPMIVPTGSRGGAGGGGMRELQRAVGRSPTSDGRDRNTTNAAAAAPGYYESPTGRPLTSQQGPVEMEDTSVPPATQFI